MNNNNNNNNPMIWLARLCYFENHFIGISNCQETRVWILLNLSMFCVWRLCSAGPIATVAKISRPRLKNVFVSMSCALFMRPTNLFFNKIFIKNKSYSTIYTFKIILLQFFSTINGIQTDP